MGGYGDEFVNARERVERGRGEDEADFTEVLLELLLDPRPRTIYFAPWKTRPSSPSDPRWRHPPGYQIGKTPMGRAMLDRTFFPDGRVRYTLIVPEHITLWFALGAYLELGEEVAVIIRGGLRADATQSLPRSGHSTQQISDARADATPIFLLPDVLALRTVPFVRPSEVPAESAIVRLETTMIEQVYPEWFGVQHEETPSSVHASANSRALQACIHAACRDRVRDGVSLPPLTVKCHGIYSINETMEALPTVNGHGALWMEGIGDASTRGLGLPTIHRFPIGELAAWRNDPSRPGVATRDQTPEGEASALLRVHPRVSLEITGVGLRCHGWENGQERSVPVDVAHTILLEGRRGALTPLASRHAFIERCGISGGREAIVGVYERADADAVAVPSSGGARPEPPERVSRLDAAHSPPNPSQLTRRGSRTVLWGCALDAVLTPFNNVTRTAARSSKTVVRAFLHDESMLDVIGGKIHQSVGPLLGARSGVIDNRAGLHLRGGGTLVRSVTFHLSEGPRPSLPASEADQPDGQDIWLDAGADGRVGYHLTVLHADSQSWWFLGGTRCADGVGSCVSLLNVGAKDVNLGGARSEDGHALDEPYRRSGIMGDLAQRDRLFLPPAVMWPGGRVPLLLLGCFFDRYCTTPEHGDGLIVNAGSAFTMGGYAPPGAPVEMGVYLDQPAWMSPEVIPRPTRRGMDLSAADAPVIAGRSIPARWRGPDRFNLYPAELVGRSVLG